MAALDPLGNIPSKFESVRKDCLQRGILFEDSEFPANNDSIYFSRNPIHRITWLRPKEICRFYQVKPQFFIDGGSRFDLNQGEMGDCWVVAAVASLSEDRRLLERVAPSNQSFDDGWYAGVFRFRFWHYGQWQEVIVDDRLPTVKGQLVFVHSNRINEFWGALLEKAYAKLHGSYEALKAGTTGDALTDMTGGLVEYYSMKEAPSDLSFIIKKALARRSLIGGAIYGDATNNIELANGLVSGHAYSVTDFKQVQANGSDVQLVRVRNPWGNRVEWRGAWGDNSREWLDLTPESRQKLGLIRRDDGEFWMNLKDYERHFDAIEICNLTADALLDSVKTWKTSSIHSEWKKGISAGGRLRYIETFWRNPQFGLIVKDHDEDSDSLASFVVELTQKDRRKNKHLGYDNLTIGFLLYRIRLGTTLPLRRDYFFRNSAAGQNDFYINARTVVKRFTLPPGEYVIIPSTWDPNEEGKFLLRVFSEAKHSTRDIEIPAEDNGSADFNTTPSTLNLEKDKTISVFKKYFHTISGEDMEVDSIEMKKCLDLALHNEGLRHLQFKYSTCRYLIMMMDADQSGKLKFYEFISLWTYIRLWLKTYMTYDSDRVGSINSFDLKLALKSLGYKFDSSLLKRLVYRHSEVDNRIAFNNFILCVAKMRTLWNRFKVKPQEDGKISLNLDEWLETTISV